MIQIICDEPNQSKVDVRSLFLEIAGWAAASKGISKINLYINNNYIGNAHYGIPRPDVKKALPDVNGSDLSGYWYDVDLSNFQGGIYTLKIEAISCARQKAIIEKELILHNQNEFLKPAVCPICQKGDSIGRRKGWHKGKYQLFHCFNCSTGFIWPIPGKEELDYYYNNVYWENSEELIKKSPVHGDTEYIHRLIKNNSPGAKTIFEAGCGFGNLLNGLKQKGYEVLGQDFSKKSAKLGEKKLGINILTGTLSQLPPSQFDCVILRHMIEHSPSPFIDFKFAVEHLKVGGLLILVTPNYNSLAAQIFERFWEWFVPPAHLFYFTLESFKYIAKRHNMGIIFVENRKGDAVPILEAWSNFAKYNITINDPWKRNWINNSEDLLKALILQKNNSFLGEVGLAEELVLVFQKAK